MRKEARGDAGGARPSRPAGRSACAVVVVLAAVVATGGCGSQTVSGSKASAHRAEAQGAFVSTGLPGKIGRVVVSEVGVTLYHFSKDRRDGGESACYGRCAETWIPYTTTGPPQAEVLARKSLLGTITRKDGTMQVTYAGWPLYTYVYDRTGSFKGVGRRSFGGTWYLVKRNGLKSLR